MKCKNCNADLKEDEKFCPSCGTPVTDSDTNNTVTEKKVTPVKKENYSGLVAQAFTGQVFGLIALFNLWCLISSIESIRDALNNTDPSVGGTIPFVIFGGTLMKAFWTVALVLSLIIAIAIYLPGKINAKKLSNETKIKYYETKKKIHLYIAIFLWVIIIIGIIGSISKGKTLLGHLPAIVLALMPTAGYIVNVIAIENVKNKEKGEVTNEQ